MSETTNTIFISGFTASDDNCPSSVMLNSTLTLECSNYSISRKTNFNEFLTISKDTFVEEGTTSALTLKTEGNLKCSQNVNIIDCIDALACTKTPFNLTIMGHTYNNMLLAQYSAKINSYDTFAICSLTFIQK